MHALLTSTEVACGYFLNMPITVTTTAKAHGQAMNVCDMPAYKCYQ